MIADVVFVIADVVFVIAGVVFVIADVVFVIADVVFVIADVVFVIADVVFYRRRSCTFCVYYSPWQRNSECISIGVAFKREIMASIWENLLTQFENPSIISRNGIFFIRL